MKKKAVVTVIIKDPLRESVEKASDGKCTVLYTNKGYPAYMTIVPAFRCEDIADDLGTGPHPAFIVGDKEAREMMIGTYLATVHDGQALSLPYQNPHTMINRDDAKKACLACGPDFHLMTNWESAALGLLCLKDGLPRGNTDCGRSHLQPEEKGMVCEGCKTLTGSGPVSWRHDGTIAGVADVVGNVWEHQDGLKLLDGKIIMPASNDFNLPEQDWPDTGATIDGSGGIRISDRIVERGWLSAPFAKISARRGYNTPVALKQALIAPCSLVGRHPRPLGHVWANNNKGAERLPLRFGAWINAGDAGVAALYLNSLRTYALAGVGFRLAYIRTV